MARRQPKNSQEIKRTDGRKNNTRLEAKPLSSKDKLLPARSNKAKKERISSYAVSAMKEVFGSEKEAFINLAKLGKDNFNQMKLLLEYAYGKPSDSINDKGGSGNKVSAPIINFFNNPQQPEEIDNTIDITDEQ
jgi:hypothetical protein|tara:strand:- start:1645 stop:2046 length:402 start_codon:yes stop_codon:yes gene_type:complete